MMMKTQHFTLQSPVTDGWLLGFSSSQTTVYSILPALFIPGAHLACPALGALHFRVHLSPNHLVIELAPQMSASSNHLLIYVSVQMSPLQTHFLWPLHL